MLFVAGGFVWLVGGFVWLVGRFVWFEGIQACWSLSKVVPAGHWIHFYKYKSKIGLSVVQLVHCVLPF